MNLSLEQVERDKKHFLAKGGAIQQLPPEDTDVRAQNLEWFSEPFKLSHSLSESGTDYLSGEMK
jgi:hypothetical protein